MIVAIEYEISKPLISPFSVSSSKETESHVVFLKIVFYVVSSRTRLKTVTFILSHS